QMVRRWTDTNRRTIQLIFSRHLFDVVIRRRRQSIESVLRGTGRRETVQRHGRVSRWLRLARLAAPRRSLSGWLALARSADIAVEIFSGSGNVSSVPDELSRRARLALAVVVPPALPRRSAAEDAIVCGLALLDRYAASYENF